jgi:hypothetical protein
MNESLMQRAQAQKAGPTVAPGPSDAEGAETGGEPFKRPDISQFVPPEIKDVVDRVVAAGVKVMYSPQMQEQMKAAIESQDPVPKKMAENVTGLLLTLDKQAQIPAPRPRSGGAVASPKSGIPDKALFPAGMELLGEAAEVLTSAGQPVTQEDYNEAARMMFVLVGQKLGGTPDQIMQAAAQAVPGEAGEEQQEGATPGQPEEVPEAPQGRMV